VAPFAGQTLTNNNTSSNTSSTTNTSPNPGNSNNNTSTTTATGITASPSNNQSSSSSHSNTTSPSNISGNNNRNSGGNSTGGITVSPSSYDSSSILPKTITDNYRINNNIPIVPLVYKIAKGNNTGTTTSANVAHASNKALSHRSSAISKIATASSNNNQVNSTSLILVAGNTEDMKFNVANNNDVPITNVVVSIASQTNGLKIVGDTLWSLASLGPHSNHQFSTKIFASASLIAQPVSFLVTMQYISHGQSQVGSFILGGTVIGSIYITASGIGINYIAGVPNLVGNLLNQGNTIGLYTTVQLINQPFSTANGSSTTNQQQQLHHQDQSGGGSAGGSGQLSSSTAASTAPAQSSAPTSLPPPQYLGDLQPDSPLPFSIPITANINNTAPGIYPVKLVVTYSDDLKNSHKTALNNTVQLAPQQKARNGQGGGIFGFLTGGGSHGRGGGDGGGSGFLGIPFLLWIAIIAAIAIAFILIRRRRRSRAALITTANGQEEEGDNGDSDEDIESLIDSSHKPSDTKKKEGGGTKPPI
jgi:predicted lipid-binding transport protein (Tim44 family)